jgi:hypothetical protein
VDADAARQPYLARLDDLLRQGRQLLIVLSSETEPAAGPSRVWQQDCASLVSDLAGGSKAHWLSRAHSDAFLVRAVNGRAIEQAPIAEIVKRLLGVLEKARASLTQTQDVPSAATTSAPLRRFDFVHDAALRPVLEAAYADSRRAFEGGRFGAALLGSCSLLEAILTDALAHADRAVLAAHGVPDGPVSTWPFDARISSAERAGLIRGGCARLPPVARRYAELATPDGDVRADAQISERDARTASQVLHVVMRDLDPGR